MNGQLNTVYATGNIDELAMSGFHIRLQLIGSFGELYVNGIKVLASAIPLGMNHTQVGIWVKSKGKVTISNVRPTTYVRKYLSFRNLVVTMMSYMMRSLSMFVKN